MESKRQPSAKTPDRTRESRSFKARLERELAKTPRETQELQSTLDFCTQPKETSLKLLTPRCKLASPKKIAIPSKSMKTLPKRRAVTPARKTPAGKALPPELRKLYEMLKGVSPIPTQAKPVSKEVCELSASPISDLVTSSDIAETEEVENLRSRLEGNRTLSEKRVTLREDPETLGVIKTVAVYTAKGLKMYELRKV